MAQLQHWVVNCTTCDSPAEYHCNTCGDILCQRCKEIHQRSRGTGYHSIVPYSERIEPGKLTEQCDNHPSNQCTVWCHTCDKAACTICVKSTDHEGHKFVQLSSKMDEQRKAVSREFEHYFKLLASWEESPRKNQRSMESYEDDIDELSKEITRATDRVCDQVRSIEVALQKRLQEMKTSQIIVLRDQEMALRKGIAEIKQQIMTAEDKLRSEDVGDLLQYKAKGDKADVNTPPEAGLPTLPKFTPGKVDFPSLKSMLGNLSLSNMEKNTEKEGGGSSALKAEGSGIITSTSDLFKTNSKTSSVSTSKLLLLPAATVMSVLPMDNNYRPYFVCAGSGQSWVRIDKDKLQLVDRQGNVKKTINTSLKDIGGMSITPKNELLVSVSNSVMSISENGDIETLFKTKWEPWGTCCLQNGDVLVAFHSDSRVVQYSTAGKMIRKLDKALFKYPRTVAQNRVTNHIYVCDKSQLRFEAPGRIFAFDEVSGKEVYKYTGHDETKFCPVDVCTDQAGHVIITDRVNDRVHILDKDGSFLQYMMTMDQGPYRPDCIDIDTDGYAWVGEWERFNNSQLKILRYKK